MVYLLVFTLFFSLFLFFLFFGMELLSPSIAFTIPFFLSALFLAMNSENWNIDITSKTYFVILFGILMLFLGELFTRILLEKNSLYKKADAFNNTVNIITPQKNVTTIISVYLLVVFILYFKHVYTIGFSSIEGDKTLLGAYRGADFSINPFLNLAVKSSLPIAYFYLYIFLANYIYNKKKVVLYFVPILFYIMIITISSGRIEFLYLVVVALVISYILIKKKMNWANLISRKLIKLSVVSSIIFFLGFYLLGLLTGKSNVNSFYNIISLYAGSSLAALDYYLIDFKYDITQFGSETLIGLTNLMGIFGINIQLTNGRILEFVHLGYMEHRTNIYTSFRRMIHDYGYIGTMIIQFMYGVIFAFLFYKIKRNNFKNEVFGILLFVYFFRYLVFSVIEERIIMNVFTSTTVLQIFIFYILTKYCIRKKNIHLVTELNNKQ